MNLAVGTRVAGLIDGFDRDFGTYAEQLVVAAANLAVVPDKLDLATASTVPLHGLAVVCDYATGASAGWRSPEPSFC